VPDPETPEQRERRLGRFPRAPALRLAGRREFGEWLGAFTWTHWGTFTFGDGWGPDGPTSSRAFYHLNKFLASERGVPGYFCCIETGRLGRVHGHALLRVDQYSIRGLDLDVRTDACADWERRFGRSQLRAYDPELGAAGYCAKYLTKNPLHWEVAGLSV